MPLVHGLLSYSIISLILFIYLIVNYRTCLFNFRLLVVYSFLLFFFCLVIFLSLYNGASLIINFAKFIQVATIIFFILFCAKIPTIKPNDIVVLNILFIIFNISFGVFIHFVYDGYNLGMIRFSGLFFDANYFALYLFIFFVINDLSGRKIGLLQIANLMIILITISLTIILVFLIYILFTRLIFKNARNIIINFNNLTSILVLLAITFIILPIVLETALNFSFENKYLYYKLFSLNNRMDAQLLAYELLDTSNYPYFFGFGSGRNRELTQIPVHSFYIQSLFSHGVLFLLLLLFILALNYYKCLSIFSCIDKRKRIFFFFICFFIICGVLDPFFNSYSLLFLLLVLPSKEMTKVSMIKLQFS